MPSRILDLRDGSWRETHRQTLLTNQGAWPLLVEQSTHMHMHIHNVHIYIYIHLFLQSEYVLNMHRLYIHTLSLSIKSSFRYNPFPFLLFYLLWFNRNSRVFLNPLQTWCQQNSQRYGDRWQEGDVICCQVLTLGAEVGGRVVNWTPERPRSCCFWLVGFLLHGFLWKVLGESLEAKRAWKEYGGKGVQITKYHYV